MIQILGIALVAFLLYGLFKSVWALEDHSKADPNCKLQADAKVVDVKTEEVRYASKNSQYKTTVYFSDGFTFVTHLSGRDDYLTRYRLYMNSDVYEQIIANAVKAHDRALGKQENL